jgi:hypothetical protein
VQLVDGCGPEINARVRGRSTGCKVVKIVIDILSGTKYKGWKLAKVDGVKVYIIYYNFRCIVYSRPKDDQLYSYS